MDSIDEAMQGGMNSITEQQMTMMKTAVLQSLVDAQEVGKPASDKRILENKLGTIMAMKDLNIVPKSAGGGAVIQKPLSESINIAFKDLPEDAKVELLRQLGITTQMVSPAATDQMEQHTNILKTMATPIPQPNQSNGQAKNNPQK